MNKFLIPLLISAAAGFAGYGDFVPGYEGYPNYQERIMHVWMNVCRTSPAAFRDSLIVPGCPSASGILNAYPAVNPVWWNLAMNRAARFHSNDMSVNSCFQHPSCDGTTLLDRILGFYPNFLALGENIAPGSYQYLGVFSPLDVAKLWIKETTGCPAAADGVNDGHRANVMNSAFNELGVGYVYGGGSPLWTEDFVQGAGSFSSRKLVSGSHDFSVSTGKTTFLANFNDTRGSAPQASSVVIEGVSTAMTLWMGAASRGTYRLDVTKADSCRNYYFSFRDGGGATYRYPEEGMLVTYGEGPCTTDYKPAGGTQATAAPARVPGITQTIAGRDLIIVVSSPESSPVISEVADLLGRRVARRDWDMDAGLRKVMALPGRLPAGVYVARHFLLNGRTLPVVFVILK